MPAAVSDTPGVRGRAPPQVRGDDRVGWHGVPPAGTSPGGPKPGSGADVSVPAMLVQWLSQREDRGQEAEEAGARRPVSGRTRGSPPAHGGGGQHAAAEKKGTVSQATAWTECWGKEPPRLFGTAAAGGKATTRGIK